MNNLSKLIVESKFNFNIDIEDNERLNLLSKSKYNSISLKTLYELSQYVVDLGLPSGTLWCKDNLGVKPNVILEVPGSIYGNYYAWGEIKPRKTTYSWANYKFAIAKTNSITKYCMNETTSYQYNSKIDNLSRLLPEDDAATIQLGNQYHIPSKRQFDELIENTISYIKRGYIIDGLNGLLLVSKINKNSIFLPFIGYDNSTTRLEKEQGLKHVGHSGWYWTSDLFEIDCRNAYMYTCYYNHTHYMERRIGAAIRPVFNF